MTDAIGWISSLILVLTIARQVYKQWQEGNSKGVSLWLFIGQLAAAIGFLVYSVLVWNPVFIATNSVMTVNSILGLGILLYQRRAA